MHERVKGWFVQLQGDDVVLARVSWWCESTCNGLPTVEADGGGGGARRGPSSSGNWGKSGGRRVRVGHGEADTSVG
jgi:hypothetical protein